MWRVSSSTMFVSAFNKIITSVSIVLVIASCGFTCLSAIVFWCSKQLCKFLCCVFVLRCSTALCHIVFRNVSIAIVISLCWKGFAFQSKFNGKTCISMVTVTTTLLCLERFLYMESCIFSGGAVGIERLFWWSCCCCSHCTQPLQAELRRQAHEGMGCLCCGYGFTFASDWLSHNPLKPGQRHFVQICFEQADPINFSAERSVCTFGETDILADITNQQHSCGLGCVRSSVGHPRWSHPCDDF